MWVDVFAYFLHWHISKHLGCAYNIAAGTKTPTTEAVITLQLNRNYLYLNEYQKWYLLKNF